MTEKQVTQNIIFHNGRSIVLPPYFDAQEGYGNLRIPDISIADSAQRYPLGTKFLDGENIYKYCAFKATMDPDLGAKNGWPQAVAYCTIAADAAQYATEVVIDVGATDGIAGNGVVAADALAGGTILFFDASASTGSFLRTIVSNTAVTTGGGECTLKLLDPIPVALIADTDHAEVMASPYSYVNTANEKPVVGKPLLAYTSGQYGWVQTWGPTWFSPQAAATVGSNNRIVVFRHDGSLDELDYSDAYNSQGQIAGYLMAVSQSGAGTQAAPFIYLMISR
jgi:hypothetical protein